MKRHHPGPIDYLTTETRGVVTEIEPRGLQLEEPMNTTEQTIWAAAYGAAFAATESSEIAECAAARALECYKKRSNGELVSLLMTGYGARKIDAIKGVRKITGFGLRDSKTLVDRVSPGHPFAIFEAIGRERAERLQNELNSWGVASIVEPYRGEAG